MIGWRGDPSFQDEPQHKKQGRVTVKLLESMDIPYSVISADNSNADVSHIIQEAAIHAKKNNVPYALVIKKGSFESYVLKNKYNGKFHLFREDAIKLVVDSLGDNDVVVATTGVASRELFEYRDTKYQGHEKDFLTVGGMGHASQIALGIALKKPDKQVFCFDGDGALLMHMGGLAIIACSNSRNFKHIVFNNSAHDSVGGQPTVGDRVDITSIARSCGYKWVNKVSSENDIIDSIRKLGIVDGPALLEIQVKKGFRGDLGRPTVRPASNKERFMRFINA